MPDYQNPLTNEHCQCLNQVLDNAAAAKRLMKDCQDCGIPIEDLQAQLEQQETIAAKIKRKFFPNQA